MTQFTRSETYIVKGDPLGWAFYKNKPGSTMWDSYRQVALHFNIDIENQHAGKELFKGLLHLDATFYFAPSTTYFREGLRINGKYYVIKPDISHLIEFIEKSCIGIIFHPESVIISVSSRRIQGKEARTEFTIKELR